jgi:nitrite reductase/ring-hydroxylating ferredoxin subunit/uncharacterized membrane protein
MKSPAELISPIEHAEWLDQVTDPLSKLIANAVRPRMVRNVLSGSGLGHPLHPTLTDLPIGAWTMATLLDTCGGRAAEPAADLLVKAGLVAAVPTAASGLNDWSDTQGPETRVGLAHAAANSSALLMYLGSARARTRGHRRLGKLLGLFGFGTLMVGGYLGGYLSFSRGVNVNRTAWEARPSDWAPVLPDGDLGEGAARAVDAAGVRVLLVRDRGQIHALSNTCSHMGGPLDQGDVRDGCVTCPWHGSTWRLADGRIVRGPASSPQPHFQTRVSNGQIEIRTT